MQLLQKNYMYYTYIFNAKFAMPNKLHLIKNNFKHWAAYVQSTQNPVVYKLLVSLENDAVEYKNLKNTRFQISKIDLATK